MFCVACCSKKQVCHQNTMFSGPNAQFLLIGLKNSHIKLFFWLINKPTDICCCVLHPLLGLWHGETTSRLGFQSFFLSECGCRSVRAGSRSSSYMWWFVEAQRHNLVTAMKAISLYGSLCVSLCGVSENIFR